MNRRTTTKRPFGFVRYRPDRAKPYLAGFNPPGRGQEVTRAFATEDEADLWLAEQHVAIAKDVFINPRGAKTLLREWWPVFMSERHLAPSSRETYEAHARKYILPAFGHRELGALRRNEIQAWANRLPVKPRTAKTILAVLQSCLKAAVVDDLIPRSNAIGVRTPPVSRRRLVVPTAEEVVAITEAMYGRYAIAVRLAAEAGLRQGEILGLRVGELDQLGRRLTVFAQAQTLKGGVMLDLPPKSDAGYRTIELAPETVEAIALHLATYPARDGLVVTTSSGRPVARALFNNAWTKAKIRSGVDRTELRFHDLRHRYASVLIAAGLDALTIKTLMGHSSITETYDTYGHMMPKQPGLAAQAISEALHGYSRTGLRTKPGESAGQGA
jgi:integrase